MINPFRESDFRGYRTIVKFHSKAKDRESTDK